MTGWRLGYAVAQKRVIDALDMLVLNTFHLHHGIFPGGGRRSALRFHARRSGNDFRLSQTPRHFCRKS